MDGNVEANRRLQAIDAHVELIFQILERVAQAIQTGRQRSDLGGVPALDPDTPIIELRSERRYLRVEILLAHMCASGGEYREDNSEGAREPRRDCRSHHRSSSL